MVMTGRGGERGETALFCFVTYTTRTFQRDPRYEYY